MKWKIAPRKSDDLIEQLLINRGIKTVKDKELFFHPEIKESNSDLKIPGIPKKNPSRIVGSYFRMKSVIDRRIQDNVICNCFGVIFR